MFNLFLQPLMEALVRKTFAGSCSPKLLQDIHEQIKAVVQGLKPAFLFEGRASEQMLGRFVNDLNSLSDQKFILITLDGFHSFIGPIDLIIKVLEKALNGGVIFIDVSEKLKEPVIIEQVTDIGKLADMLKHVHTVIKSLKSNVLSADLKVDEQSWNGCTLTGLLCGFPVVYYFNTDGDNCLSMKELTQFEAVGKASLISSFTAPTSLLPRLQTIIEEWSRPFGQVNQRTVTFDGPVAM